MRKLFQKNKPLKTSRDGEDTLKPTISTPVYHQLATHGAHIHAISLPVFQQSTTQISPLASQDSWSASGPPPSSPPLTQQDPMGALPNPHSPPSSNTNGVAVPTPPIRSGSLHATSQALAAATAIPRSASPISVQTILATAAGNNKNRFDHIERRNPSAVGAVGILSSLEPPKKDGALSASGLGSGGTASWGTIPADERYLGSASDLGHGGQLAGDREKEKKKGFWSVRDRDREKEKEKEREREQREREREAQLKKERHEREHRERGRDTSRREDDSTGELTRMIGYLTATAAEDWSLLMEVCERASSSDASAKEAVTALRREFKYGEPPAQLSAARVWAVILRNSSEVFISKSTSRKFLDTIEDLLSSSRTSPVVRERLLEVVAAAAYASGSKKGNDNQGFKGLWRKVRPFDKPEEGVPFDMEDAMFQPPQSGRPPSHDVPPPDPSNPTPNAHKKRKSPSNQIIPLEEDIRRLFQECKIGLGNAAVLADALLRAKPEDLKKVDVIKEFHAKCQDSQELICTQIPWSTSLAERSRSNNPPENAQQQQRNNTTSVPASGNNNGRTNSPVVELTVEEKLLAALLAANAELLEVLRQWEDLNRLAIERKVEDRSKRDVRINKTHREQDHENSAPAEAAQLRVSHSRTPSPPSRSNSPLAEPPSLPPPPSSFHLEQTYQLRRTPSLYDSDSDPSIPGQQQNLAPPPAAPHGPRSPIPAQQRSTPPSPAHATLGLPLVNGHEHAGGHEADSDSLSSLEEDEVPSQPSAKALGKRKVVDVEVASGQPADVIERFRDNGQSFQSTNGLDPDVEDDQDSRWRHPPVRFVYDAVAERRRQMMTETRGPVEQQQQRRVNGVH